MMGISRRWCLFGSQGLKVRVLRGGGPFDDGEALAWGIEVQAAIAIPNMADPFSRPARSNGSQWDPPAKNK